MMNEPVRQNSIIDYMARDFRHAYTIREVANALGITTNAALKAFKRLRIRGRVFHGTAGWYLSSAERRKIAFDDLPERIDTDALVANDGNPLGI